MRKQITLFINNYKFSVESRSLFIVFIILFFCVGCQNKLIDTERDQLEKLWRMLVISGESGYTLKGVKPVSLYVWDKRPYLSFRGDMPDSISHLGDARAVWEKYQKTHPSSHFSLIFTEYEGVNTSYVEAVLINKRLVVDWA